MTTLKPLHNLKCRNVRIDRGVEYRFISGGNDNLIKMWKITCRKQYDEALFCSSELVYTIVGHGSLITDVKFNAFGNMAASTSLDKTVRLWGVSRKSYPKKKIVVRISFDATAVIRRLMNLVTSA